MASTSQSFLTVQAKDFIVNVVLIVVHLSVCMLLTVCRCIKTYFLFAI